MPVVISGVPLELTQQIEDAYEKAMKIAQLKPTQVEKIYLMKSSVDARRRSHIHMVCQIGIETKESMQQHIQKLQSSGVTWIEETPMEFSQSGTKPPNPPVVVGFGPAGMFAGLVLARAGYAPIILERGQEIDRRVEDVEAFWHSGVLHPQSNVQFGEGGAGTFSDGKLTTRIKDPRCSYILKELVRFGAPEEILYKAKPHIGTDHLRKVVKNIREEIIRLGGQVLFNSQVTDLVIQNSRITGVVTHSGTISTPAVVLAVGHSARDTFRMLMDKSVLLEPKAFSVGVRIEHLQKEIDKGLYGDLAGHPALPKGEYQLSHRIGSRGVYTFCMCPGGVVVPSASAEEMVVTNGMSYFARDGENANCAVAVSVDTADYGNSPLDGILFQEKLERAAFFAGGGGYKAPAQTLGAFMDGKKGLSLKRVKPSYSLGVTPCDFNALLPKAVGDGLQEGIAKFGRQLPGFAAQDAVLTGLETRTSSPVRIIRGETLEAVGTGGLYPCGEGAGYAGGIMSAAVDGIKVASQILSCFF